MAGLGGRFGDTGAHDPGPDDAHTLDGHSGNLPVGKVAPHMRHPVLPAGLDTRQRRLLAGARGRVLDIGDRTQRNLPHYGPVESIVFAEPAELDTLPEHAFDTVVCVFVLCGVDDLQATLAAVSRRLAPEGRLLFLEHVRGNGVRSVAQRLSTPVWQRVFAGCRPDRDTVAAVRAAGFLVTDLDRFTLRWAAPMVSAAVQGAAKRVAR